MRGPLLLALSLVLASGCANDPATAPQPDAGQAALPYEAAGNSTLPALAFLAGEFNQTLVYEDSFTVPDTCLQDDCRQVAEFDLTPQVPADAPVELALSLEGTTCLDAWVSIEDGGSVRDVGADNTGLAAHVVRGDTGTVTLYVRNCSLLSGELGATSAPFRAEVRTAVRPTVLPTRVPVSVQLAAGDRLLSMGEDVEELVVYAPGQQPVRIEKPFEFTAGTAGTHVVVALGQGEAMLHGPGIPMTALPILTTTGTPRALQSGQDLSWDVEVPGIPLWITIELGTEGGTATGGPPLSYMGGYTLSAAQAGAAFFEAQSPDCVTPCSINVGGRSLSRYGSGLLADGMGIGPIAFKVTNTQSMGYQTTESVTWVQPVAA
ncbi:MAG: hypothetical protein AABY18_04630 [Candidatus Thermoplasmatota archaeon]